MKKFHVLLITGLLVFLIFKSEAQLSGTYSVGSDAGDDYVNLYYAIEDLENNGVDGPVIFELSADYNPVIEAYPIYINAFSGASETNTLTIKPAVGTTHVIERDLMTSGSSVFAIIDASYVTIDGSNNGTDTRDLTISSLGDDTQTGAVALYTNVTPGTNIVIKNCILTAGSKEYVNTGIYSDYFTNVIFQNNKIYNAQMGIITFGDNVYIVSNEIGSDVESEYLHYGISTQFGSDIMVVGNTIYNLVDNQDFDAVRAISVNDITGFMQISENIIDNIIHTGNNVVQALSFEDCTPNNMLICNNQISNIASDSYTDNYPGAIAIHCPLMTSGMEISYNTIYMPENNEYGTGTGGSGVFAGGILIGSGTGITLKNNIIVNELGKRDGGSGIVLGAAVLCNDDISPFAENDNNLFYAAGDYNIVTLAATSSLNMYDLAGWQAWTGSGTNSFFDEALFNSGNDLHLQACSPAVAHAVDIPEITFDLLGIIRDIDYPTMGAYEYEKIQASDVYLDLPVKGGAYVHWTSGNGCKAAVFMKQGHVLPEFPMPINGETYAADENFGLGDEIGTSGWYCIFNDIGPGEFWVNGEEGLYTVMVCEYFGDEGNEIYLTESSSNNPVEGFLESDIEMVSHLSVNINPNPSSGKIDIMIDRQEFSGSDLELKIIDIAGREVYSIQSIDKDNLEIDLSGLVKGLYFVKIQTGNRAFSEKLILN